MERVKYVIHVATQQIHQVEVMKAEGHHGRLRHLGANLYAVIECDVMSKMSHYECKTIKCDTRNEFIYNENLAHLILTRI